MRSILRHFASAQSGATSIETAGMAVVSVVLIVLAAKTVGTRAVTSFDQSVGNVFGTSEPAVKESSPSRPCRAADERERPECRIR